MPTLQASNPKVESVSRSLVGGDAKMHVSVIIPARNAGETLEATLESLRVQTDPDWEAIVIDDGSTDATVAIAERFAERDRRFRVVSQANRGVSAARNTGIGLARYDWLLFLDADDWIVLQHLERMTQVLKADDSLDAIYCGWAYVTPDGHEVFKELGRDLGDLFALHAEECPFAIHAYVVRRALVKAVGAFDTDLVVCEDWDLWQRIARTGARFGAVHEMLAPCRVRAGSASMDGRRTLADGLRVLQQGHAPDTRVSKPHLVYPEGLPADRLVERKFYLLCAAAGLVIGREEDAKFLLDALKGESCGTLNPYAVADCVVQSAMLSACRPLHAWTAVWQRLEHGAEEFLNALEVHTETPGLARRTGGICKRLVLKHMAPLSPFHRARALMAWLLLLAPMVKSGLTRRARFLSWRLKQLVRNGLRVTPTLYRRFCALHRRYGTANRAFFEDLFAERPDPWDYTNPYEQTKYEQTLDLIPPGLIEEALELACAEGHSTLQLAPRVGRLLATDIAQTALDRAAERCRGLENVQFRRLDFMKNRIPGCYDLIVCSEVLYFCRNLKRLKTVARKLAKALKPGGHLVMAHGNVSGDEPDSPGFDWEYAFGAKSIGETFREVPSLAFVKELRTPLYRVQLFRRKVTETCEESRLPARVIEMEIPTPLPPLVADQVLWKGRADRLPILLYHRVAPNGSDALAQWRVSPEAFERQLCYLRDAGFHSVCLENWGAWVDHGAPLSRGAVLITFDDGYRDFVEYAWPLLKRYGFSASVYLVAGEIGRANRWDHEYGEVVPLLGWREIRELQAEGVSFGSHSLTHPMLTSIPLKQVIHELTRPKDILEQGLGIPVNSFSYPHDEFNKVIQYITGICGYDFALSCEPGLCTMEDSLLALPRIEIEGSDTVETFAARLESLAPGDEEVAIGEPVGVPAYMSR